MAERALRRNIMRSALTTLGIVIGISAVIAMMEIGQGSSTSLQRSIESMGANNLLVLPGTATNGGVSQGTGSIRTLTPEDADAIFKECSAVVGVAPLVQARTQLVYGNRNWVPMQIYGTTPAYLDVRDWQLAEGDAFTDRDVRNANKVCMVGKTIVQELFQGESPIGETVRIQNVPFKILGVLSPKGANMVGMDQDDIVLAPWTTIKFRVSANSMSQANQATAETVDTTQKVNTLSTVYPNQQLSLYPGTGRNARITNVDQIAVRASRPAEISLAIDQITTLLRERHRLKGNDADDFNIRDLAEITKTLSSASRLMMNLLLIVALLSLVVGGVGIMNIMLVSVTERTHEIGLRMAVGARGKDILQQFLVEAVLLCLAGGAMGILVGRSMSLAVAYLLRWPVSASVPAILAAFAVSATVGVAFGFYRAWKASRLDPIDALRYE
ncbi:MAG: ABC transporter permease [Planctomycetota bacterium]